MRRFRFGDTDVLFQRRGAFGNHPLALVEAAEDFHLGEADQPDGHLAAVGVPAADDVGEAPAADRPGRAGGFAAACSLALARSRFAAGFRRLAEAALIGVA